ncbi:hypothetical protein HYW60_02065 [Candidatus Kaiserbacteria bacterium]|nr:hypothetical protein [Candidatus Kaiserbacteria bacterium]
MARDHAADDVRRRRRIASVKKSPSRPTPGEGLKGSELPRGEFKGPYRQADDEEKLFISRRDAYPDGYGSE